MLWKAQELPPSSKVFGIGPASAAQDVTCTFGHLQRESALRRTARQKTPRMPRKPPRPGSHPGRSSSTSTSHRRRKAARKRRLASAHSPPPQMTPVDYSLFRRRGARRGASLVDRGCRLSRCDLLASYHPATGHVLSGQMVLCGRCARSFWDWYKARMGQMQASSKRSKGCSFADAAMQSIHGDDDAEKELRKG